MVDTNIIIRNYLLTKASLTAVVGQRIYAANPLPENVTLPAISFFTRGGKSSAAVPEILSPSIQFTCWADDPEEARTVYRALYDVLNGLGAAEIVRDGTTYYITGAFEEVHGQDVQDIDIPGLWKVLVFYSVTIMNY